MMSNPTPQKNNSEKVYLSIHKRGPKFTKFTHTSLIIVIFTV